MLTTFEDEARISIRVNQDLVQGDSGEVDDVLKRMAQWIHNVRELQGETNSQG